MIAFTDKIRVHRAANTDDAYGTSETWGVVSAPVSKSARPDQAWSGDQQKAGGEMQGAKRRWFVRKDVDVAERDVIEVVGGPNAPAKLRVVSLTVVTGRTAAVHHKEVNVETFTGSLA